jgi:hypothetical protein
VRPAADELVEITGRDLQVGCDAIELGAVHLAQLIELALMLEPIGEPVDQIGHAGIRAAMDGHRTPRLRRKRR